MKKPFLILASASPRRVELLKTLNIPFEVIPSGADELHDHAIAAAEICVLNAERKAAWVAAQEPQRFVLGADTLVSLNNELFGKPRSNEEAAHMLSRLQGRTHEVITGVSFQHGASGFRHGFAERTCVTFKVLSAEQIADYVTKVHLLDKAGAYAIQEHGELIIESIQGSYSNVVGLPIERLGAEFELVKSRFPELWPG